MLAWHTHPHEPTPIRSGISESVSLISSVSFDTLQQWNVFLSEAELILRLMCQVMAYTPTQLWVNASEVDPQGSDNIIEYK